MPSLKIKSWTWGKITTERQVNDASWTEDHVLASSPVGEWINAEYPR